MQLISFLLGLFAIGCVLYGISAGVQIIQRGFSWLIGNRAHDDAMSPASPIPVSLQTASAKEPISELLSTALSSNTSATSPLHHSISELRELFALYQQGALTQEEFEGMKQSLLASAKIGASLHH